MQVVVALPTTGITPSQKHPQPPRIQDNLPSAPPPSTVPGNWVDAGSSGCLGKILTALPSTLAQTEHCNIPKGFITSLPLIISVEFLQGINMIYEIISHCICIAIVTNLIPQQLQKYCVVFWLYISAVFVLNFSIVFVLCVSAVFVLYFSAAAFSIIGAAPVERSLHRHLGVWHHHHHHHHPRPQSFAGCPWKDPGFCERFINTKRIFPSLQICHLIFSIFLFLQLKILGSWILKWVQHTKYTWSDLQFLWSGWGEMLTPDSKDKCTESRSIALSGSFNLFGSSWSKFKHCHHYYPWDFGSE